MTRGRRSRRLLGGVTFFFEVAGVGVVAFLEEDLDEVGLVVFGGLEEDGWLVHGGVGGGWGYC